MEKSNRNKWLNSFVRITSEDAKTDDDSIYIVYRQQNGWCTLHNIEDSSCKIVKQCELTRMKLMRICLPLHEVERVLEMLEKGMHPRINHASYSKSWENVIKDLPDVCDRFNKNTLIQIINSKYPENLYFTYAYPNKFTYKDYSTEYNIHLNKLVYKSEKIVRN